MWQYVKRYAHFAIIAALFMGGEVLMDLIQPGLMRRIVDDGVLGLNNNGVGNLELVWRLGIQMIGMVLIVCQHGQPEYGQRPSQGHVPENHDLLFPTN